MQKHWGLQKLQNKPLYRYFQEQASLPQGITRPEVVFSLHHGITAAAKSLQSSLTLCDPIDGSPPGSAVPGILQGRTLEWGAIAFSVMV